MKKIFRYMGLAVSGLFFLQMAPAVIGNLTTVIKEALNPKPKVAIVSINNTIMNVNPYYKQIKSYLKDDSVKAILLYLESGGGAAGSCQGLYQDILALKAEHKKPIISFTHNICASGAYYIACASDYIIATPSAIVGSIGALIGNFEVSKLLEKYDVKYKVREAGDYKLVLNPFVAGTPEKEKLLQSLTDECYRQFTTDVATSRKLDLNKNKIWANGKIFTGEQALKLKLIDATGSNYFVTKKIKELAKIDPKKELKFVHKESESKLAKFFGKEDDGANIPLAARANLNYISKCFEQVYNNLSNFNLRLFY